GITVRTGAATLMIGTKPSEGEPSAMDLRYQATIIRTARECQVRLAEIVLLTNPSMHSISGHS
ncbi:MAG: hypothetical protein WBX77_04505, partial [Pseudolabrys sp.]